MPTYRIVHKIWTVAELDEARTIEGFQMRAIDTGSDSGAWIAIEEIEAPDFITAFNMSRPRLVRTVDALCVVTQCSFSLAAASSLVYRLTDNPDHVLCFRHLRKRATVGMTVWKPEQLNDVAQLVSIENPGALHYFREAVNAATSSAQLAMLVITAEALAGQSKVIGTCQRCGFEYSYGGTNRGELEAVLGAAAYTRLYKSNNGSLRNRLLHGSSVDENAAAEVSTLAYDAILEYLVKSLGLSTIERITAAPRTFQSFERFGTFLRCATDAVPDLPELELNWQRLGQLVKQPAYY
jgi:hypothetical protein